MKLLKKLGIKVFVLLKSVLYRFIRPKRIKFIHSGVPHYSQWESKELIGAILKGNISAKDDPKWRDSGAKSKLDYLNWSWNACGIACLQMILTYKFKKKTPLVNLCVQSLKYDCFVLNLKAYKSEDYEKSLDGLFYKPFIKFIKEEFGFIGTILSPMVLGDIINRLDHEEFIMASVGGPIYGGSDGHLVLVIGYDLKKRVLYINDPSTFFKNSHQNNEVRFEDFMKRFGYRGLAISTN